MSNEQTYLMPGHPNWSGPEPFDDVFAAVEVWPAETVSGPFLGNSAEERFSRVILYPGYRRTRLSNRRRILDHPRAAGHRASSLARLRTEAAAVPRD